MVSRFSTSPSPRPPAWRAFLPTVLAVLLLAVAAGSARGQTEGAGADPSELFLKAFTSVQQAESAEGDGKLKVALSKYRFAASLLEQINQGHPNWQPLILQYRARKTSEAITKLQQKISLQGNALGAAQGNNAGPQPGGGRAGGDPAPNLSIDDDPLPEADRPTAGGNGGNAGGSSRAVAVNSPNTPRRGADAGESAPAAARADASVGKATQEARSKIEKLNEELRDTRKQLEGAQKEKKKLQDQLESSQDELKTAQKKFETTKKNRDEIEADLAKVQDRLKEASAKNTEANSETRKELRKQLADLKDKLEQAETVSKAAAKEKDSLAAKLAASQKKNVEADSELAAKLAALQAENAGLVQKFEAAKKNREEIEANLAKVQERLKEAAAKNAEATSETRKELRKQLADLKDKLEKAESTSKAVAKEKDLLAVKLAAAQKKAPTVPDAGEIPKDVTAKLTALQAENASLVQRLGVAEKTIADLNAEASKKKEEAEAVQVELAKLKEQLVASRDKNDRSETEITTLRKQLEDSADRMKEGLPREEAVKLAKENDLLRNISLRLLKDQARRSQARKLMGDELAKLEVQSKTLTEQLDLLGQPTVQLTDEERALFKDPLVNISDSGDPSTMAASIVAVSPTRPAGSSADPGTSSSAATDAGTGGSLPGAAPDATTNAGSSSGGDSTPAPPPPVPAELVPLAKEAKDQLDHGHYPEAEEVYNKLVARAPKSVYALSNLGVVLSRQGKLKSAETKLKKATALAPNDPFSQATLGIVYYQMRRFDDALDCLTKAIQLDPKNASAHNYLGITSSQKGWPEAAVEELEKALALNPNYADAHFNLAVVYAINQPPAKDKAKQHYALATQLGAAPDPALEKLIN